MIVSCAGCGTKYKVSDDKVGPFGVKVKCPKCRTVFEVKLPEENQPESLAEKLFGKDVVAALSSEPAAAPGRPAPEVTAPEAPGPEVTAAPPAEPVSTAAVPQEVKGPEPPGRQEPAVSQEPSPEPAGVKAPPCGPPAAGSAGLKPTFPFKAGEEEPRILARALVSDILFYNRDSRDRGIAEGKMLAYLGKEIARSWDTYKERIGLETAVEADFFRQAVNEILGEGTAIL
jgi:predicted Zn finger-like uncharacterized protein